MYACVGELPALLSIELLLAGECRWVPGCQRHQLLQGAVCCCCVLTEKNAINATCMIEVASSEGIM